MMEKKSVVPETKGTGDVAAALSELMGAFELFKETNDQRLAEIERRSADVVTEEKLARIGAAVDEQKSRLDGLFVRQSRPALSGRETPRDGVDLEHRSAFAAYMRSGNERVLATIEAKAMSAGSGRQPPIMPTAVVSPAER